MSDLTSIKPLVMLSLSAYKRQRFLIKTGDLISFQKRGGIWRLFSLLLGKDSANHSALAYVQDQVVWCAEITNTGSHMIRLSAYMAGLGGDLEWVKISSCPVDISNKYAIRAVLDTLKLPMSYSYWQLFLAGVERAFNVNVKSKFSLRSNICSMMAYRAYLKMGWRPEVTRNIIDPQELFELVEKGIQK